MLRFLVATMMLLVGWLQPAPLPTEAISLDNADQIEQLQQIGYGTVQQSDSGEYSPLETIAFSPNGTLLAIGGYDELLQVWNIETNAIEFSDEISNYVFDLVFSPDGETLFVYEPSEGITRWATSDWTEKLSTSLGEQNWGIVVSPDGGVLVVALGARIGVYDSTTFTEIREMTLEGVSRILPTVVGIALSPDGEQLASISGENTITDGSQTNPRLSLWDMNTGELLNQADAAAALWSLAFSPDGTLIATGNVFANITLWDAQTLTPVATLPGDEGFYFVTSLVFSTDSSLLIASYRDGTLLLWDVEVQSEVRTLEGHTDGITDLALSADGTLLASASLDGTVRLWGVR